MLWIALHCPTLSLDWIERRFPVALIPAMAATIRTGNQVYIRQANKPAQQQGVAAHQPLASALSLFPDLVVVEHDPHEEMKALREAAYAAFRFTPHVVMQASGLITEVSESLKLFGGLKKLCQLLNQAVAAQGLQLCVGIAPTAKGAWLLAQSAPLKTVINGAGSRFRSLLDSLPIYLLETAQPYLEVIRGIGCKTLADLRQLPRSGLARRFGPDLLTELDRACGDLPDPQQWLEVPEYFQQKTEFMTQVESGELIRVPMQRMIGQMCGWLSLRHAAVLEFSFILHHEYSLRQPHRSTPLHIKLSEQSDDVEHLMLLLRERLERMEIAAAICGLELIADQITAGTNPNLELFPTSQSEATSLNRFIEKVSSRLGPQAITGLNVISDHRPEYSQRSQSLEMSRRSNASCRKATPSASACHLPRPAWLMAAPLQLKVQRHQPVYGSPLKLIAGPERIEAGWWDDAPVARDYFIAENALGQLLWIYREHSPAAGNKGNGWYLQGLFG
ncbi:DNA polymerase IV-like protein ImuB [Nitrosospira lacus]|uniref:DNA polymerase IV-like protein ImuB n=1 Tax=Nitrosospira lacus TaxID=1288494 RepID=A0A1W6SM69_9PROT|nr:DNA polymerase Y family protein [Nitrosospira lacus]ARO86891.1 DNA polymerase IV-like protein ImuB [Nitrosospira lacus]